jgi:5-methylcytosine-specific restriction endonuclease McrA
MQAWYNRTHNLINVPAMLSASGNVAHNYKGVASMGILTEKKCSRCGVVKSASEFYKARSKSTGLFSRCKECDKKVYAQKRDKILAYQKEYYKNNREKVIENSRHNYLDLMTNRYEVIRQRRARYQKTEKGRELARIQLNRRRAREKGVISNLTTKDVKKLYAIQGGKCLACGVDLSKGYHIDHIVPLSKGGGLTFDNVQLLCPRCNQRKANKVIDYRKGLR